ncbi:MAG: membrane c-type cytochrome cy, partial [uncultured Acetobacteraceae bacterium]
GQHGGQQGVRRRSLGRHRLHDDGTGGPRAGPRRTAEGERHPDRRPGGRPAHPSARRRGPRAGAGHPAARQRQRAERPSPGAALVRVLPLLQRGRAERRRAEPLRHHRRAARQGGRVRLLGGAEGQGRALGLREHERLAPQAEHLRARHPHGLRRHRQHLAAGGRDRLPQEHLAQGARAV